MFLLCFNIISSRFSLCWLSLSRKWSLHSPQGKRTKTAGTFHNGTKAYQEDHVHAYKQRHGQPSCRTAGCPVEPKSQVHFCPPSLKEYFKFITSSSKKRQRNETPPSWSTSESATVSPASETDLFIFKMRRSAESTEYSSLGQHGR